MITWRLLDILHHWVLGCFGKNRENKKSSSECSFSSGNIENKQTFLLACQLLQLCVEIQCLMCTICSNRSQPRVQVEWQLMSHPTKNLKTASKGITHDLFFPDRNNAFLNFISMLVSSQQQRLCLVSSHFLIASTMQAQSVEGSVSSYHILLGPNNTTAYHSAEMH